MEVYSQSKPPEKLDVAVIGAGVVGLAVARAFTIQGREVAVFESEETYGTQTSSRGSGVIHAGIYYKSRSLKARLCVEGRDSLYEYCVENNVPHQRVGKIIVATSDDQIPTLEKLKERAKKNGVDDLETLTASDVKKLEPLISSVLGLLSPSTGIIDPHELMTSFKRDILRQNAWILLSSPILEGKVQDSGILLSVGGREPTTILCRAVINCAGLKAQEVAHKIDGLAKGTVPPIYYAKGHYFELSGASSFSHLVYPIPVPGGLGIHATLDLAGRARFGPDVKWVDKIDYSFAARAEDFYPAIRKYYPGLPDGVLQAGYTGIRPKIAPPGSPEQDFMIKGPSDHGVPGLINLFGIESPGLTASLAIARHVASLLDAKG